MESLNNIWKHVYYLINEHQKAEEPSSNNYLYYTAVASTLTMTILIGLYGVFCMSRHPKTPLMTAEHVANNINLGNKVAIVTDAISDVGKEVCRVLLKQGAYVIMGVTDREKGDNIRCEIVASLMSQKKSLDDHIIILSLDLSSLESIKNFASNFNKLDLPLHYLINNSETITSNYELTKDEIEKQFQVNYLGHYYLTRLLISNLSKASNARVINVSSTAHRASPAPFSDWINKHYQLKQGPQKEEYLPRDFKNYGITKACQIIFSYQLNNLYKDKSIKSVSLHPGNVGAAKLWNHSVWFKRFQHIFLKFLRYLPSDYKTVEQCAATIISCVVMKYDELKGGEFYRNCTNSQNDVRKDLLPSTNDNKEVQLWELSEQLIRQAKFDFDETN